MRLSLLSLGVLCAMSACGDDPGTGTADASMGSDSAGGGDSGGGGDAGVVDNPGTGTGTLVVDGVASAEPSVVNSTDLSNYLTTFSVRITKAGTDVTTGTVSIASSAGSVALLFDGTTMRWRGAQAGYFQNYTLDATSDVDNVMGVTVHGPDIHSFTAPTLGATVDSTMPLALTWTRTEMAEAAAIRTRLINPISIADAGTYSLPAGSLKSKPQETENEDIELTRSQRITPAGGAAGSTFRVAIRNHVTMIVQPTTPP